MLARQTQQSVSINKNDSISREEHEKLLLSELDFFVGKFKKKRVRAAARVRRFHKLVQVKRTNVPVKVIKISQA